MTFPVEFMLYGYLRDKKLAYTLGLTCSAILWTFVALRVTGG
jgi:hypothetical protein